MECRRITIFNGIEFDVPKHIVRIDIIGPKTTHGWQVRYGKPWKFFSDHSANGSGAKEALTKAHEELKRRIETLPAPTKIRQQIASTKTSGLPSGISGPFQRLRKGRNTPYFHLQVSLPIHGGKSKVTQVYIGTANTLTEERIQQAVTKSMDLRKKYIASFQQSATKLKREQSAATPTM